MGKMVCICLGGVLLEEVGSNAEKWDDHRIEKRIFL